MHPGGREDPVFTEMARRYDQRVGEHGAAVEACDWSSRAKQGLRFEVLAGVGPLGGASLLDVGCGLGDLLRYLRQSGQAPSRYTGIDISAGMVAEARRLHPRADFRVANVLDADIPRADFVLASGVFTYLGPRNRHLVEPLVRRMFELSRVAVAWNSLSMWADRAQAGELHLDPCDALRLCGTISPRVILRHDYHPADFTAYMFRAER